LQKSKKEETDIFIKKTMKQFLSFCALLVLLIQSCQSHYSKKAGTLLDTTYNFTGKIKGLDSGWVYLFNRESASGQIDSAQVRNGFFQFTGKADEPTFHLLGIGDKGQKDFRLGFFVQNGQIILSASKDSLEKAVITGSPAQDEFIHFLASQQYLDQEEAQLEKLYDSVKMVGDKRLIDSLEKIFRVFDGRRRNFVRDYAKQHPSSYISPFEVFQYFSYDPDVTELDSIYQSLSPAIQRSYFGQKTREVLATARKTAPGQLAPDFAEPDGSGKPIPLSSLRGKYVLVDFWASWCGPCRAENPNVEKAYQQYHARGLNILGVSLDEKKDKWQEAVKKDHLDWQQVSDLQGWKNTAAVLYGVQGIPMNFLIGPDGKIIAKCLRGDDLTNKLAELLK
jgi:peroxiredoxin